MQPRLLEALATEWRKTTQAFKKGNEHVATDTESRPRVDVYQIGLVEVSVSTADRDPYDIFTISGSSSVGSRMTVGK
jgi:hypothetical protein